MPLRPCPDDAGRPGRRPPGSAWPAGTVRPDPQRILFLACVIPNPLTMFATVSAASSGVPFGRFFTASLSGFLVLSAALAVAGQGILAILGISWRR